MTYIFVPFLLLGLALVFGALYSYSRPAMYAIRIRPFPKISQETRRLTESERNAVASITSLVDMDNGPLRGELVIRREDVNSLCHQLGYEMDGTWSSQLYSIDWLALKLAEKPVAVTPTDKTGLDAQRGGVAITRGARANAVINPQSPGTEPVASDSSATGLTGLTGSEKVQSDNTKAGAKTEAKTPWYMQGASGSSSDNNSWVRPEPTDAPFRPHHFSPRAEILAPPKCPRVLIGPDAYKRMLLYVELAPKEVGWLGLVKHLESGDFLIHSVHLLEQEVTAVETELSTVGQDKLCEELKRGKNLMEKIEVVNTLRFWGHSHVYMGVSPSGTDEKTMITKGQDGAAIGLEWYIRGIFNKLGVAKFDIYRFDRNYRFIDVPWAVVDPDTGKIFDLDKKTGFWARVFGDESESTQVSPQSSSGGQKELKFAVQTDKDGNVVSSTVETNGAKELLSTDSDKAKVVKVIEVEKLENITGQTQTAKTTPGSSESKSDGSAASAKSAANATTEEKKSESTEEKKKKTHFTDSLPEELRPDDALRAEVQAEYDAKVDERMFRAKFGDLFTPFSGSGIASKESVDMIDDRWVGDHHPGSAKTMPQSEVKPTSSQTTRYITAPRDSASDSTTTSSGEPVQSFFGWLMGFFFSASTADKPHGKSNSAPSSASPQSVQPTESHETAKKDAPAGKDESGK